MRFVPIILLVICLVACTSGVTPGQELATPTVIDITEPAELPSATVSPPTRTPTQPPPTSTPTETASPTAPQPTSTAEFSEFPDSTKVAWAPIAGGLERPVFVTHAGDGSERLFVIEQAGTIRIVQNGALLEEPFLDIRDRVGSDSNEQGLLGLAFHPDYLENGLIYVNYTDKQGDTVIARYQVNPADSNRVEPNSEERLLFISQPYPNHNGGMVAFGPDGFLYLGLGDGGSAGDPQNNAQSLQTLLGKILRIDVNQDEIYTDPTENIFSGDQLPEIWAFGLRNPWRFSFDRQTGDLFIGDVGQNQWEEINFLPANSPAGTNFGWKYLEGNHPYSSDTPPADTQLLPPVAEYSHGEGCSVTGGVVYRGEMLPDWNGVYLFGDYCSGNVYGLFQNEQGEWEQTTLFTNVGLIASFGEDERGEVYLVDHSGQILRLERN